MKKFLSLLLSALLIFSVFGSVLFTADGASQFTVKSVSLTGKHAKRPVSKAEIDAYLKDDNGMQYDDDDYDDIDISDFGRYSFALKLSNGKSVVIDPDSVLMMEEIDSSHFVYMCAYISGADYKNAVKKGSKSIYAYVECSVFNAKLSDFISEKNLDLEGLFEVLEHPSFEKTFKIKLSLIDRYVKKLAVVSGVPKSVYKNADYVELNAAKFTVTYYNNTTKTYTVKRNSPLGIKYSGSSLTSGYNYDDYTLNNEPFYCTIGKTKLCFEYEDAPAVYTAVTVNPCPYKQIEVKDCTLADDVTGYGKGLTSLSCEITKTNGKKINVNKTFEQPLSYGVAAELDGYYLSYYAETAGIIPEKFGGNTIVEVDFAGYEDTFNSSEASNASFLSKIIAKFEAVMDKVMTLLNSVMY